MRIHPLQITACALMINVAGFVIAQSPSPTTTPPSVAPTNVPNTNPAGVNPTQQNFQRLQQQQAAFKAMQAARSRMQTLPGRPGVNNATVPAVSAAPIQPATTASPSPIASASPQISAAPTAKPSPGN